jgi:hypothetical protein
MQRLEVPEVLLPEHLALEIETVESPGTKVGIDTLAIGDRRIRGETRCKVSSLVRNLLPHRAFPNHFSVPPIHRDHAESFSMGDRLLIVAARGAAVLRGKASRPEQPS